MFIVTDLASLKFVALQQQRCRPACIFCFSLPVKYSRQTWFLQNLHSRTGLCSLAGWLVENNEDMFSRVAAHNYTQV